MRTYKYIPSFQKGLNGQKTGLCKSRDCIHPRTRGQHQTKASGVAAPFWDSPIWLRRVLDEETDRNPFRTLALSTASSSLYPRRSCSARQRPVKALPQSTRCSSRHLNGLRQSSEPGVTPSCVRSTMPMRTRAAEEGMLEPRPARQQRAIAWEPRRHAHLRCPHPPT